MGTVICVAIWILLLLGFIANFIVFAVMSSMQNVLGIQTCAIIFLIFIAIIGSAVLTYNTIKEEKKDEKIKDYKKEVHELWERIRDTEIQRNALDRKLDNVKSFKKEYDDYISKLDDLKKENEQLRKIICKTNGIDDDEIQTDFVNILLDKKDEDKENK